MPDSAQYRFVQQQGFRDASPAACERQYPALMFQPRLLGVAVVLAVAFQTWPVFLALSVLLWWNAFVPTLNLFDMLYNRLVADAKALPRLTPAPGPRRFAQGMAATFMLVVGLSLAMGWQRLAWVFEALLVAALAALIFGKFCLGSHAFLLLRGEADFANRTLPWARAND